MHEPALSQADVRNTMTAMVTVIMGRNEATGSQVDVYPMEWKGETVSGLDAAEAVLMESLTENTAGWIEYLSEPDNYKVVVSMDFALNADLTERLEESRSGRELLSALDGLLSDEPPIETEIIDIRTGLSISV